MMLKPGALVVALAYLVGCASPQQKFEAAFLEACNAEIQSRLLAPSSFRLRGDPSPTIVDYSVAYIRERTDKFARTPQNKSERELRKTIDDIAASQEESGNYKIITARIDYEAQNAMGVYLAMSSECLVDFYEPEPKMPGVPSLSLYLDRQTHMQYVVSKVR